MELTTELIRDHVKMCDAWQEAFNDLMAAIGPCFARSEARLHAREYLQGLLGDVPRKNGWQLAEHAGDITPYGKQNLLGRSPWDADELRGVLWDTVEEALGREEATWVTDDTGFIKKGRASACVKRQYTGTAGRTENCQVGVFWMYRTAHGHALWDRELFVPQDWANDSERRKRAKIPESVVYRSKIQIALDMFQHVIDRGLPAKWVLADAAYGKCSGFRRFFEDRTIPYIVAVPKSLQLFYQGYRQRLDDILASLASDSWQTMSAGLGCKGPREADWIFIPFRCSVEAFDKAIMIRRHHEEESGQREKKITYFMAFAPKGTSQAKLVQVQGRRSEVETSFEQTKQEVGLADYQVRSWHGWYKHITLTMVAYAFLTTLKVRASQHEGEAEKKTLTKTPASTSMSAFKRSRGLALN